MSFTSLSLSHSMHSNNNECIPFNSKWECAIKQVAEWDFSSAKKISTRWGGWRKKKQSHAALNFSSTNFTFFQVFVNWFFMQQKHLLSPHIHAAIYTHSISHFISSWGFNELTHSLMLASASDFFALINISLFEIVVKKCWRPKGNLFLASISHLFLFKILNAKMKMKWIVKKIYLKILQVELK